jgi:hypothetical protein
MPATEHAEIGRAPMRNPIGFIPRDYEEEENDGIEDELLMLRKMWNAETVEVDQMLKDSHESLFEQVRGTQINWRTWIPMPTVLLRRLPMSCWR